MLNSPSQCNGLSSQNPRDTFGAKNVCSKCTRSSLFGPSRVYAVMLVVFPKKQTPKYSPFPERLANASLIKEIKYQKVKPIEKNFVVGVSSIPSLPFPSIPISHMLRPIRNASQTNHHVRKKCLQDSANGRSTSGVK